MNFRCLKIAAVSSGLLLTACTVQSAKQSVAVAQPIDRKNAVTIVKNPLQMQEGAFVEYANMHSAKGITEWFFHCYTKFQYNIDSDDTDGGGHRIQLTITKVTMTIALPITTRLGNLASKKMIEHEHGHAKIVTRIYEKAQDVARESANSVVALKFEGQGKTRDEAIAVAIDNAAQTVCKEYRQKTVDVANEISRYFDEYSKHGAAPAPVDQALEQAYQKYNQGIAQHNQ